MRNRLRRRLRAIFATREDALRDDRAYLIVANSKTAQLTFRELDTAVRDLLGVASS